MIGSLVGRRIFAHSEPTDLRKGFAGLAGIVEQQMGRTLLNGDLFLFVSRRRTRTKILH